MSKKNLLSGRDKEMKELAEQYEAAKAENKPIYLDADDLADLADWYANRHKQDMALEVVEYGLSIHINNTALLVEQAYLHLDVMNKEKAQETADLICEDLSEVIVLKANLLLNDGKKEEAEKLLETLDDKYSLGNIIDVAYMYIDMGYPDEATVWLQRGAEQYDEDESFIAVTADCHYSLRQYDKAKECYNKLIDQDPYSAPYWYGLARCYFEQNALDKAIEACDFAIVADDEFAEAFIIKGHCYFQIGNEEEALANYEQAKKLHALAPAFIHSFIGLNFIAKGEWEKALGHFQQSIDDLECDYLTLALLYSNAALCLYKMGDAEKAHQYCTAAYEADPAEVDVYLIEGRIYMEEGKYEKATELFARALEQAPYGYTWHEIGLCNLEMGQLEIAKQAFEKTLELEPDYEYVNERLAYLCIVLKDEKEFAKYNKLCTNPMTEADVERIQQTLQNEEDVDIIKAMKTLFDSFEDK